MASNSRATITPAYGAAQGEAGGTFSASFHTPLADRTP